MTIHRGKVHDYLGMDLDFSAPKTLKIGMIKYVNSTRGMAPNTAPIFEIAH